MLEWQEHILQKIQDMVTRNEKGQDSKGIVG